MAFLSLSIFLSAPNSETTFLSRSSRLTSSTPSLAASSEGLSLLPPLKCLQRNHTAKLTRGRRKSWIVGMASEEEKMTRRSPLDFPIEWDRPKPGRRPDIFPQFSPMKTPLPPPMPADDPPEEDEEDEEDEEEKEEEEEEDPEKQDPDKPEQWFRF